MKSLISLSIRCFDALLWSLGLSSVVMVLMAGFYFCWTTPFGKSETKEIVITAKIEKPRVTPKAKMIVLDKDAIYAGR
ncbi:hypothetical protein [Dyadobacter diqingensis]|uniref:hypothetical protein n=1 Tax=Dyadobacter diqingensis TaxID=2938121 RepID=UPI0020C1A08F|nr:hypothetical protein [Dyadobacter diqingensis]